MSVMIVVLLVALTLPGEALAQRKDGRSIVVSPQDDVLPRLTITPRTGSPSDGYPRDPPPRFTIPPRHGSEMPLPSIGLPLPPIGLRPPVERNRFSRHSGGSFVSPWAYPVFPWTYPPFVAPEYLAPQFVAPEYIAPQYGMPQLPVSEPTWIEPVEPTGSLFLDVQPGNAQVFVDGYYVGTPDDLALGPGALALEPGPHRIELSASGYERVSFDVRIAVDQTIRYSRILKSIEAPAPFPTTPPSSPAVPTTFYLIPGCYMGNVPPKDAHLPSTCDINQVIKFQQ
jgi:hypothetical protein